MSDTVVFITSGTTWNVPSDFTAVNTIEVLGAGGAGATGTTGDSAGGGGGGGAYSKIANLALTPGATIGIGVGSGDTYFNGANYGAASVAAKAGGVGSLNAGGSGGAAGSGIGTTKNSGGNGGSSTRFSTFGASGGGGAAGPNGNGGNGGNGPENGSSVPGSGGGGANGGGNGTAGGSGFGSPGIGGSGGTGGGAGGSATTTPWAAGVAGGNGTLWDASHGPGGGGSGGNQNPGAGGAGGNYGGGGGGGACSTADSQVGAGGAAGVGIIVVTYTPATASAPVINGTSWTVTNATAITATVVAGGAQPSVDVSKFITTGDLALGGTITGAAIASGTGNVLLTLTGVAGTNWLPGALGGITASANALTNTSGGNTGGSFTITSNTNTVSEDITASVTWLPGANASQQNYSLTLTGTVVARYLSTDGEGVIELVNGSRSNFTNVARGDSLQVGILAPNGVDVMAITLAPHIFTGITASGGFFMVL